MLHVCLILMFQMILDWPKIGNAKINLAQHEAWQSSNEVLEDAGCALGVAVLLGWLCFWGGCTFGVAVLHELIYSIRCVIDSHAGCFSGLSCIIDASTPHVTLMDSLCSIRVAVATITNTAFTKLCVAKFEVMMTLWLVFDPSFKYPS